MRAAHSQSSVTQSRSFNHHVDMLSGIMIHLVSTQPSTYNHKSCVGTCLPYYSQFGHSIGIATNKRIISDILALFENCLFTQPRVRCQIINLLQYPNYYTIRIQYVNFKVSFRHQWFNVSCFSCQLKYINLIEIKIGRKIKHTSHVIYDTQWKEKA